MEHSRENAVAVLGLELCTPLGLTARATLAEMAAGTVRFLMMKVRDAQGEPVRASVLTLLEPDMGRTERVAAMAVTALDACRTHAEALGVERLPLLLALPEEERGAGLEVPALLGALMGAVAPIRLDVLPGAVLRKGRAGLFVALRMASELLRTGQANCVLVGAADSLCDEHTLSGLAKAGRCLSSSTRDGIIPGEGAGFLLLTTSRVLVRRGLASRAWVLAGALAREPRPFLLGRPSQADGLTEAFRQLRQHPVAGTRRVDHVLSGQTGERFWAREFTHAYLRNVALMPEPLTVSLIAESLGDAGAASAVIQLGYALYLLQKQERVLGRAPRALVYGCSDGGDVGACVVECGA
ncbi:MAG TPA: beta-ketoacyl synthase N-terminal-like domain-containing protein [Archangium sp.]|nr:beta-ketoacyl synthase N-terminal-like domain-containing protein [Archangium sp.]